MRTKFETTTGEIPVPEGRVRQITVREQNVMPVIDGPTARFYDRETLEPVANASGVVEVRQ